MEGQVMPNGRSGINQVLRELKREQAGLWSCCNSLLEDSLFVAEIRQLYPSLPLVANLRCGLWYSPSFDATCYFKSTDGHNGWWNFSTTRLNMGLAELAAGAGGAIVVDATRKGKRFPDSLSKTIPIWTSVLNRAIARVRAHDARREEQRRRSMAADAGAAVVDTQTSISVAAGAASSCDDGNSSSGRDGDGSISSGTDENTGTLGKQATLASAQNQQQQQQQQHERAAAAPQSPTRAHNGGAAARLPPPLSPQLSLDEWVGSDGGASPRRGLRGRRRSSSGPGAGSGGGGTNGTGTGQNGGRRSHAAGTISALPEVPPAPEAAAAGVVANGQQQQEQEQQQQQQEQHSPAVLDPQPAEADGVTLQCGGPAGAHPACGPATPRLGSVGSGSPFAAEGAGLEDAADWSEHTTAAAAAEVVQDAAASAGAVAEGNSTAAAATAPLKSPSSSAAATSAVAGPAGGPTPSMEVCASTSFEFPSPDRLAEAEAAAAAANADADAATGAPAAAGHRTTGSGGASVDAAPPPPEMPLVVLNGTPHEPGVAASILDIWRSADLEELADLPPISELQPAWVTPAVAARATSTSDDAPSHPAAPSAGGEALWAALGLEGPVAGATHPLAPPVGAGVPDPLHDDGPWASAAVAPPLQPLTPPLQQPGSAAQGQDSKGMAPSPACTADWDTSLHLPLWVAPNERRQIEARLEGWVERLLEVGADVRRLSALLTKPLRPLWISQSSLIWTDEVAQPADLPFIPIILVSASQPHQYKRLTSRGAAAWTGRDESSSGGAAANGAAGGGDGCSSKLPRRLRRSTRRSSSGGGGIGGAESGDEGGSAGGGAGGWSYVYVPGAGDDEESWAMGLTPTLFWEHLDSLLAAGPAGIREEARRLVLRRGSSGGSSAAVAAPRPCSEWRREQELKPRPSHALAPRGCEVAEDPAPAQTLSSPLRLLGQTGLALGNAAAAAAPGVWRSVGAVLCLGQRLPSGLQAELRAAQLLMAGAALPPAQLSVGGTPAAAPVPIRPGGCAACRGRSGSSGSPLRYADGGGTETDGEDSTSTASGSGSGSCGACENGSPSGSPLAHRRSARAGFGLLAAMLKRSAGAPAALARMAREGHQHHTHRSSRRQHPHPQQQQQQREEADEEQGEEQSTKQQEEQQEATEQAAAANGNGDAPSGSDDEGDGSCADSAASSYYSICSDDENGLSGSSGPPCGCQGPPRVLWLPVQSAKKDRSALADIAPQALAFVSAHLAAGRTVLIQDDDGDDACVCAAVAVLLGCFSAPDPAASAPPSLLAPWPESDAHAAQTRLSQRRQLPKKQQRHLSSAGGAVAAAARGAVCASTADDGGSEASGGSGGPQAPWQPPQAVTRETVRQRLAFVMAHYPQGRPSKLMLKQVFNFFLARQQVASAAVGGAA